MDESALAPLFMGWLVFAFFSPESYSRLSNPSTERCMVCIWERNIHASQNRTPTQPTLSRGPRFQTFLWTELPNKIGVMGPGVWCGSMHDSGDTRDPGNSTHLQLTFVKTDVSS
jgi:hypothetical protein